MSDWAEIQLSLDVGDLAILSTETVYGLAGIARFPMVIDQIYAAKGRAFNKPLAIVVRDQAEGAILAEFSDVAKSLAAKHWPGPLTLVLDAKDNLPLDPRTLGKMDGQTTIALRCPDTEWRTELRGPLALTSANLSGGPDLTKIDDVEKLPDSFFEHINWSVEDEDNMSGKATTIVRVSGKDITILRQGELDISL